MANSKHHVTWVIAAPGFPPQIELFGQIRRRLACQRRIGGTDTLRSVPMAGRARRQSPRGVTLMVQFQSVHRDRITCVKGHAGIITRNCLALVGRKLFSYPSHLRMIAAAIRIGFKLPFQIPSVEPGQSRRAGAISTPVKPMTREAGVARAGLGTADRYHTSIFRQAVERARVGLITTGESGQGQIWQEKTHAVTTRQSAGLFRFAVLGALPLIIAACKPPPDERQFMPTASAERGSKIIERVGCGACHNIPGIDWPQGRVGPHLAGLAERGLIAGKLPNQPDILAAYIRDAPALDESSGMPAMPISDTEARDIAAYLYEAKDP